MDCIPTLPFSLEKGTACHLLGPFPLLTELNHSASKDPSSSSCDTAACREGGSEIALAPSSCMSMTPHTCTYLAVS